MLVFVMMVCFMLVCFVSACITHTLCICVLSTYALPRMPTTIGLHSPSYPRARKQSSDQYYDDYYYYHYISDSNSSSNSDTTCDRDRKRKRNRDVGFIVIIAM